MAIVKVLLSRLDPNKKLSDRVWKEPCVDWLTSVVGGTLCGDKMGAVNKEALDKATIENQHDLLLNNQI